ncbi:primosomal protein N' (replication factor Y) - superfamily II helicase [Falsirhodobacter xinxiangensis]|uniref:primosomal protein N' (replication factor Y) - superfamily II helicase n=1 Tax=Falsirhodobacter xinxiangensis TaxID=2530049 RepID=UPI0010AA2E6F|nr:primosomal protein N' (replication factor Y) - superfamily II helicase [Rhodobacter xinxiangensis]
MPDRHWPCDRCGADLRFAPGQTQLVCDHCGHMQEIPHQETRLEELDLKAALRGQLSAAQMETVPATRCPNCGALIEFQGASHARECPFCATPVVVGTGTERLIKPQAVVPFRLTEREAKQAMSNWLGSLWFAPNRLQEYARKGRSLTGMYVPWWTFDAATRSTYVGARGEWYYETQMVTVNVNGRMERRQQQVRKTRWFRAQGRVGRRFDDVLVLASASLPRDYVEALEPWDLSALEGYRGDYLAGFTAEGYTVPLDQGWQNARQVMAQVIHRDVIHDIGGDEQRVEGINTDYADESFKHVLLPVWMAAYRYGGKSYRFVVNGQTGKVRGERPYSTWKIALAVALAIIVAAVFLTLARS